MMIELIKKHIPSKYKKATKRYLKIIKDSILYSLMRKKKKTDCDNIVFVCKGNVCRSTFAELYLKKSQPMNTNIVSCGLEVDQGGSSPHTAIRVAEEFGVDMGSAVAKNISTINMSVNVHIVAMEFDHYKRMIKKYPYLKDNIVLLKDYLPWSQRLLCNIADPYGGEEDDFRLCFYTIKNALDCMIQQQSDS